jgi:hypothetical protein
MCDFIHADNTLSMHSDGTGDMQEASEDTNFVLDPVELHWRAGRPRSMPLP